MSDEEEILVTSNKSKISRARKTKAPKKLQSTINVYTSFPTCRYSGKGVSRKLCNFSNPVKQHRTFFDVLPYSCIWMVFDLCDTRSLVRLKRSCTFFTGIGNCQEFSFSDDLTYTGFLTIIESYIVQTHLKNVYTPSLVLLPSSLFVYKQNMRFKVGTTKPSITEPFLIGNNLSPIDKSFPPSAL